VFSSGTAVSVVGLFGIFIVEFLIRFAGGRRDDPMPFVLFVFLLVFVNTVGKELYKRLEDIRQRSEQMEDTLDELGRSTQVLERFSP